MAQPTNKKENLSLTTGLAKSLIKAFPQYKGLSEKDFLDMLDKIAAVETQNKNIYQLEGGPGRGYFQMELESAPVAYERALNIRKELKERGIDLPKLPNFSQDFTKLTKDEQAFYTLTKMVGAAGAKREQGQKDYYLNPKDPKKMWLDLHWAGKAEDKPARSKHWDEIIIPEKIKTLKQDILQSTAQATKAQPKVEKEIEQPDLHPAGPEKTTVSATPVLSNKRIKQLANAKFVPNAMNIPIFTEKGTFIWDKPAEELDIMLHGRPGPTVRRAQTIENVKAVEKKEDGGEITMNPYLPNTPLATGAAESTMGPEALLFPARIPLAATSALGRGAITLAEILNPFGGLRPSKDMMYRGIGKEGFKDAMESGVLRAQQQNYPAKRSIKEIVNSPKQFTKTYYSPDAEAAMSYGKGYVAAVPKNAAEFAKRYGNKDWSWSTAREIPIQEAAFFKKYPVVGYKKILKREDGGPVYNWIPPNYPRVGARNKQGGWLDEYDNGDKIQQSLYTAPRSTTQTKYTPITVDPKVTLEKPNNVDNDFTKFAIDAGGTIFYPLGLLGGALDLKQGDYLGALASLIPFGAGFKALKSLKAAGKGKQAAKLNRGVNNLLVGHGATQVIDAQRDLVNPIINKKANGGSIEDQKIPDTTAYEFGNKFMAYPDKTLTNYQMGTPKSTLPDGKIVDATPEIPAYAHGATVWTKQTTPSWVAGTPTPTTTQREINPSRTHSPGTAVPYPEIKITGPTNPYMPASPPVLQGYNPYKGPMRLHAPDTRRMAYGGYVPSYGLGSTVGDIGKLFANTLAAPLEQVTGNNLVNFNYANKGMANAAAVSEGILGGATDIVGTAFLGPAYGMGKGQVQRIGRGIGTSQEYQRGADKWANKTGQLTSSAGNLVAGIASGNPQQIVGGAGELLGTAGSEFNSKALGTIGQLGSLGSMFINPAGNTGGLTNANLGGVGDINVGATDMMFARNGGRITSKYKKRVGIPYAINPGVSNARMYVGPTTQRGITFKQGGWLDNL